MGKNVIWFILVIVVGALLGSFLGKFIGIAIPQGPIRDLFIADLTAGLSPATLDLRIIEITLGCMLKINLLAIIGIICSALLFKKFSK
ncbi:MAG: DUF4321 domain-containing protein [Elusimicrobia bacterium]|nr:DUF4321 domain-containing protein [Elusimicrobiota bacterium]